MSLPAGKTPPLRAVFMGTPDFAARILGRVLASPLLEVAVVCTQPDRPAGRGNRLHPPPVKVLALERGLRVLQPRNFGPSPEGEAACRELAAQVPDLLLVAAYGLLLPRRVLDIPALMPVNVHASLLPRYRGAAPVQRAIMNGDPLTGVSIMRMETALDAGPILLQRAVGIGLNDTAADLLGELADEGGALLLEFADRLLAGALRPIPQDAGRATCAPRLTKEEGRMDFALPAHALHARIRGLTPWPGALLTLRRPGREDLAVTAFPGHYPETGPLPDPAGADARPDPGAVSGVRGEALLVRCGDGCYAFPALRPAGKQRMSGRAFFNGYVKDAPDARFLRP
ncbi:MAG: methionyl-tRNA formyltransferase [Desulfovibrio sp.]|jgi:methionyl-tRNA formyltransferase|nr:methionyl-tRNA formyltransferase [Desulfovibrio sp.]